MSLTGTFQPFLDAVSWYQKGGGNMSEMEQFIKLWNDATDEAREFVMIVLKSTEQNHGLPAEQLQKDRGIPLQG